MQFSVSRREHFVPMLLKAEFPIGRQQIIDLYIGVVRNAPDNILEEVARYALSVILFVASDSHNLVCC